MADASPDQIGWNQLGTDPQDPRLVSPIFQPDVVAYRLGQVERETSTNTQDIAKLTETVQTFIAAMPATYVPRIEHQQVDTNRTEWSLQKAMIVIGAVNIGVVVLVNVAVAFISH